MDSDRVSPIFSATTDPTLRAFGAFGVAGLVLGVALFGYGASPKTTDVGYAPIQPVEYSHKVHAGKLGIDCRFCHVGVEQGAKATIPSTELCWDCHSTVGVGIPDREDNPKLALVKKSMETGEAIPWVRVHDLPDYVFFDHSAHVTRGVGCVTCHGRVDQMDVVRQTQPLSMGWCLGCHGKDPGGLPQRAELTRQLRPPALATAMTPDWPALLVDGNDADQAMLVAWKERAPTLQPSADCSTCHR